MDINNTYLIVNSSKLYELKDDKLYLLDEIKKLNIGIKSSKKDITAISIKEYGEKCWEIGYDVAKS